MKLTNNTIHIKDVHQELHPTIAEGIKELIEKYNRLLEDQRKYDTDLPHISTNNKK